MLACEHINKETIFTVVQVRFINGVPTEIVRLLKMGVLRELSSQLRKFSWDEPRAIFPYHYK